MNFNEIMQKRQDMANGKIWADKIKCFDKENSSSIIFLGAGRDAQNLEKLKENRVNFVLNVADDVPNFFEESTQIEILYKNLRVGDFGSDEGISRVFPAAIEFVTSVLKDRGNCLIHCANGSNRSATIVIALVMSIFNYSLSQAWSHVVECHEQSSPLADNRKQLLAYELELYGETTMYEQKGTLVPLINKQDI